MCSRVLLTLRGLPSLGLSNREKTHEGVLQLGLANYKPHHGQRKHEEWYSKKEIFSAESANVFQKEPDRKYFSLCGSSGPCSNFSTLPLWLQSTMDNT